MHASMMILWLQPRASAKTYDAGMAFQRAQTSLTTRQNPLLYVPKPSRAFSYGITLRLCALFRCDNAMLQVVFFDLGQSACSASAVQFTKSKLKVRGVCVLRVPGLSCDCVCAMLSRVQVVGTAFNRNLGGRNFDDLLVKKLVEVRFASCACPSLAFVLNALSLTDVCVELIVFCRNSRSSARLTAPPRRRQCSACARLPPRPGRSSAVSSAVTV